MQAVAAPTPELIKELATTAPGTGVLSAHLRTDPRDPANTNHQPAWHIALRNGLRAIEADLEAGDDRDARLAFRELSERVDLALPDLDPAERGRSLSVFTTADGALDVRITLQLPLLGDTVRWDRRPFISPLVDVVDHGRATGLVLVDSDEVVLMHWEGGRVTDARTVPLRTGARRLDRARERAARPHVRRAALVARRAPRKPDRRPQAPLPP